MAEIRTLGALGELAQASGRVEEAVTLQRRAADLARAVGHRSLEALALANVAYALAELRDFAGTVRFAEQARALSFSIGDRRMEVIALAMLALAQCVCGKTEDAAAAASRAIELRAGDYNALAARIAHAVVSAERGEVTEAKAVLDAIAARSAEPHLREMLEITRGFVDLAIALDRLRVGDLAAATPHVQRARSLAAPRDASLGREHGDLRVLRTLLREALARHAHGLPAAPSRLEVHEGGRWFRRDDGAAVRCARRPVLRELLRTLGHARLSSPGVAVTIEALVAASWPGQKMRADSARRRLQVAISRLRELGLAGLLQNDADGYLFAADAELVFSARDPG